MSLTEYQRSRGISSDEAAATTTQRQETEVTKVEFVDITETETKYGDTSKIVRTGERDKSKKNDGRYNDYAIVLRRRLTWDGKPKDTRLEIRSRILRDALQEVLGDYPFLNLASTPIIIDKPYAPLFHFRKELREYAADKERTQEENEQMKMLLCFVKDELWETELEFDGLMKSSMISYPIVWTIFRPEEVVVAQRDHYVECFVVESFSIRNTEEGPFFSLVGRSWDYNGVRFGPVTTTMSIRPFQGMRKVSALEVYPIQFHANAELNRVEDFKQKMIQRGQKWRSIVDLKHRQYDGFAWTDPLTKDAKFMGELITTHITGRIILDYATHQEARPQLATILSKSKATADPEQIESEAGDEVDLKVRKKYEDKFLSHLNTPDYVMTDEQALLCPARIRGFSLIDKNWALFLVEKVTDIIWAENSLGKLEIEQSLKGVIEALVNTHGKPREHNKEFDDIIAGKGKGLIFLLSGPPGLGKTLTAGTFLTHKSIFKNSADLSASVESVAEQTRRPLYAITSGELGIDVIQTDLTLRRIFTRAKTWNAILLLDEADVFLAKRERADLQRNAFVSIFLRLIEYYQGILFLTTNRVDDFDQAFKSRIHLTINYEPLNDKRRAIIWKNLLHSVRPNMWDENVLQRFGREYTLNGREIKNLIRTALALAENEEQELTEEHIIRVHQINKKAAKEKEAFQEEKLSN